MVEIENLSQDSSIEWLDQGVAELLTTNLAEAKGLVVISTQRVRELIRRQTKEGGKLRPGEAQEVAREARADLLLSGALLKIGSRLRLDLRVQETETGKVLFADKVEGEDTQAVFGMVDQTTAGILGRLAPGEAPAKPNVAASLTSNLEALHAYEKGRSYLDRGMVPEAISSCKQATELDPQFAMAYYSLADALFYADITAARHTIDRAAQLSERLPLPRQQKLLIQAAQLQYDCRWEEAEQVLRTAVREFPLEIEPRFKLANLLFMDWKWRDAKPVYEEILRLDDRDKGAHLNIAVFYAFDGDLPQALISLDRAVARYADCRSPRRPEALVVAVKSTTGSATRGMGSARSPMFLAKQPIIQSLPPERRGTEACLPPRA